MRRVGSGTPVVLIHGIQMSGVVWAPVVDLIAGEAHEVLVPVLAGHRGGAPVDALAEVSVQALTDDVERQLDVAGIETGHLVGNSLGGWVALELARRGRARSVVALSPAGGWCNNRDLARVVWLLSFARPMLIRQRTWIVHALRPPLIRRLALLMAMERGDRVPHAVLDQMLRDMGGCAAYGGFLYWIKAQRPMTPGSLAVDCPVRIAWGERDRVIPFKRYGPPLLAAVPEAEHVTLPGVGHMPMFDDPALVAHTILEVVADVDSQGGPAGDARIAGAR